ncbi:MAG: protein translocase subunit SecF [Actinobacteria bacterium]|nr:protein translocase subunit SecF [Actinomycetota bacterium]
MSFAGRLYRGENSFDFIGSRRRWYLASGALLLLCVLSFAVRGFNFGIEFQGGTQFQFPASTVASLDDAEAAVHTTGPQVASRQYVGSGATRQVLVRTSQMSPAEETKVQQAVAARFGLRVADVSVSSVSSSWGHEVTRKALTGLIIFVVLVSLFIAVRFAPKMAAGAIVALLHDLLLAAGVYSLVGFEVTPATVVGLLTILGFSLYDTVVVFDKVAENTRGILGSTRQTYSEAANLAVNQTLMRSINTSLIALLPVAGLLFVGAGLLGVGTLKDLALVLLVGIAAGTYSSIFIATPLVVDLTERETRYAALRKRVLAKRATEAGRVRVDPAVAPVAGAADGVERAADGGGDLLAEALVPGVAPRPGARPQARKSGGRPQGRKKGGRPQARRRH